MYYVTSMYVYLGGKRGFNGVRQNTKTLLFGQCLSFLCATKTYDMYLKFYLSLFRDFGIFFIFPISNASKATSEKLRKKGKKEKKRKKNAFPISKGTVRFYKHLVFETYIILLNHNT